MGAPERARRGRGETPAYDIAAFVKGAEREARRSVAGTGRAEWRSWFEPDDHDVVGPVGRPAEQLDELDLGDVRVLELVDQDVAELALPAAQDVRAAS